MVPEGTDPDNVEISILTPGDYDVMVVFLKSGEVKVSVDPGIGPEMFSALLMSVVHDAMNRTGITMDGIKEAAKTIAVHTHPPDEPCPPGEHD